MAWKIRAQYVTNKNTPRSIRSRLSYPRRKAQGKVAVPEVPVQPVAHSSSGKMALGPWLGSFGSMGEMGGLLDQDPPSPTLFATSQGRVFADLNGAPVASADLFQASAEVVAQAQERPGDSRSGRLAMAQEVGVLRRKAEPRVPQGTAALHGPRANVARRRYREIGQARKMN